MKQKIFSKNAPQPIGPYSQAIIANNMIYLSGQIAINPKTNLTVTDSIENETNMVLKNIQNILKKSLFNERNYKMYYIFIRHESI